MTILDRFRLTDHVAIVTGAGRGIGATTAIALAAHAHSTFGRLDMVVNNVGGTIPNTFLDTDVAYLEEAFHFNVATAHALSRAAVPLMLQGPAGEKTIISVSSMLGRTAARGYLAYGTATKQEMETSTPLDRIGEAEDVAAAIVYQASAAGRFVTGKLLEVDGGIQQPNLDLKLPDLS